MPDFDASTTQNAARCAATLETLVKEAVERLDSLRAGGTLEVLTSHGLDDVLLPPVIDPTAERYQVSPGRVVTAIGVGVSDERLAEIAQRISRMPATAECTLRILPGDVLGYEDGNLPALFLKVLSLTPAPPERVDFETLLPTIESTLAAHDVRQVLLDGFPVTPSILSRAIDRVKGVTHA